MPIAFLLGGIGVLFVAISFVELGKRIPGDGSAYAYNAKALGEKAGFISGWLLVLTYVTFVQFRRHCRKLCQCLSKSLRHPFASQFIQYYRPVVRGLAQS